MEVAASAPENIFKDTAQTLIAPPPLDAYSRRVLVLARLQQYQRLQAEDTHGGDAHNVADPAGDSNLRFRIAQVTLLQDVEKLTRIASDLEAKLLGRRRRVWFTHASLALISHAIMSQLVPALWGPFLRPWQLQAELGRHQTSLLGAFTLSFHLIQWSGYFIAFYDIVKSERRISNAASLRGGLTAMASAIGDGAPVEDTTCLSAELWNKFLWEFLKR